MQINFNKKQNILFSLIKYKFFFVKEFFHLNKMEKMLLIAGAIYNQCVIYYLRNNEVCDNTEKAYYVKFRKYALGLSYFMFVLFLLMVAKCKNENESSSEKKSSPLVLIFTLMVLCYNIMLLVYIFGTEKCASKLGSTNATIGKAMKYITIISIVVDFVIIVKHFLNNRASNNAENDSR